MAKTNIIENLFSYLALYSALLPFVFFVTNWKKCNGSTPLWVIIFYGVLVDFLISYCTEIYHHNKGLRPFLYASFTLFEYAAFACFIFLQIKNKPFKKMMFVLSAGFFVFLVVYYVAGKFKTLDSIPIGIETILILIFSFYFLYEELRDTSTLFIYHKPVFWIIFGITIYLAGSFFIYIYSESLSSLEGRKYWYITNLFSIIKNIFFCIALLLHARSPKQKMDYNLDFSSLN